MTMEEEAVARDFLKNDSILGHSETIGFNNRMLESALIVDKYYTPLLCLFGTLGNSLSLAVFCLDVKYRSQSSSFYLSALAISDTGFLLNLFSLWLGNLQEGGGLIASNVMCPLVMYLGQVTCFISIYLTVAFSIERYVAVHYPFSRPRICTRSKAKKVIAVLTSIALLLYSYAWVIAKVIKFPTIPSTQQAANNDTTGHHFFNSTQTTNVSEKSISSERLLSTTDAISSFTFQTFSNFHFENVSVPYTQPSSYLTGSEFHGDNSQDTTEYHSSKRTLEKSFTTVTPKVGMSLVLDSEQGQSENNMRLVCTVPEEYFQISEIANYFDSVATLIIPFFLITFINVRIAACVWKLQDQRQQIVASSVALAGSRTHSSKEESDSNSSPVEERCSSFRYSTRSTSTFHKNKPSRKPSERSQGKFCQHHLYANSGFSSMENLDVTEEENDFEKTRVSPRFKQQQPRKGVVRFDDEVCIGDNERVAGTNFKWDQYKDSNKSRQSVRSRGYVNPVEMGGGCKLLRKSSCSSEVRVTKTLLLVSTVFLVLNLPSHAIRCAQFIQSLTGTQEWQELLLALQCWANILFNTNFAVNFLLYCLSGRNFRKSLENIILRKCKRRRASSEHLWTRGRRCENGTLTSTCTERLSVMNRRYCSGKDADIAKTEFELTNIDGHVYADYSLTAANDPDGLELDQIAAV